MTSADRGSPEARARAIEQHFLGSPAELTREQVIQETGVDLETSRRLWRALGFVDIPAGVPAFGRADVLALGTSYKLLADTEVPDEVRETVTRALGQAMSHLAETQVEAIKSQLMTLPEFVTLADTDPDTLLDLLFEELGPVEERLQELLLYAWRRHLAAAATRAFASATGSEQSTKIAVGFADIVGWTALTRDIEPVELERIVARFEATVFDCVPASGGRVVKVIGDEVMFIAPSPAVAARVGAKLLESQSDPQLRIGLAWGAALMRGGDVFGAVVNLASRCTSIAHPGTMLADRGFSRELSEDPEWVVRRIPPRSVRGYERLEASVVRPASPTTDEEDRDHDAA